MAKSQLLHLNSNNRTPRDKSGNQDAPRLIRDENYRGGADEGPSVILMCAFFLGLASIAVVVVTGHFPWFTLAPAIVLLMAAHIRRIEAKFERASSSQLQRT